jgi:hypothetical protein
MEAAIEFGMLEKCGYYFDMNVLLFLLWLLAGRFLQNQVVDDEDETSE